MKDLRISYINENGERIHKEYDYVFDFTDAMESDEIDIPMLDYTDVEAVFFEKEIFRKNFDDIQELYLHCCEMCHHKPTLTFEREEHE